VQSRSQTLVNYTRKHKQKLNEKRKLIKSRDSVAYKREVTDLPADGLLENIMQATDAVDLLSVHRTDSSKQRDKGLKFSYVGINLRNSTGVLYRTGGRRSLWERGDRSPQYLDWGNIITNVPPIFLE